MANELVGKSHKNMGNWKSKIIAMQHKGSSTTGKSKGIITTPLERTICRRNRSWKHPLYNEVMATIDRRGDKKAG